MTKISMRNDDLSIKRGWCHRKPPKAIDAQAFRPYNSTHDQRHFHRFEEKTAMLCAKAGRTSLVNPFLPAPRKAQTHPLGFFLAHFIFTSTLRSFFHEPVPFPY